ncbi:hypothetical protein G1H11_08655 [Phytoactinopolyspora alkaliphila]|uniref:Uncharacterized protein n=1 Tax=Phytoactinopolyspora alkaliphila TaxID=1783498 RepID=A0A6N9YK53_9ACTN|nr:hypothetical protein [Phytoactinopolyspora alkaliphila]NED95383.1 hypothetical protein [Phytoactinopolyspora alkaliphila]
MRNTHQRTAWFLGAAALVLTAGCSASGSGTDTDDGHNATGPLAEFMPHSPATTGLGGHGFRLTDEPPEHSDHEILHQRRIEELVAECMRDAGFEYVPESLENDDTGLPAFDEAYALEPGEFAEQYGYGLTTITFTGAANEPEQDGPNDDIRDALSESARKAYDAALWGEQNEDSGIRDSTGCYDQAHAKAGDDGPTLDEISVEFDPLFEDVDALFDRVRRDPRVSAAVGDWQECMADHGFPGFDELDQPYWSVHQQASEVSVPEDELPATAGEDGGVIIEGDARFVIDPQDLARLKEYETELATADFRCRDEHEHTYRDVALELEEEFVDAHRSELERYREIVAGQGDV